MEYPVIARVLQDDFDKRRRESQMAEIFWFGYSEPKSSTRQVAGWLRKSPVGGPWSENGPQPRKRCFRWDNLGERMLYAIFVRLVEHRQLVNAR